MSARTARTGRVWLMGMLVAAGGVALAPAHARAQTDDALQAARALYRSALTGPRVRSSAVAGYDAELPEANSGCSLSGIGWTWPACDPTPWQASASEETMTSAPVRASVNPANYASPACIGEAVVFLPAFSRCVAAGARAETSFGENRAYAVARYGFTNETSLPNTETPEVFDDVPVTFFFAPSAVAESEWVAEFTPDFTDYLRLQMGIEMHDGVSFEQLPLGGGTLTYALFERPSDNLVAPPEQAGCDYSNPFGDFGTCDETGWSFYGRDRDSENAAARTRNWGWQSVAGGIVDVSTLGVTPLPLEFFMVAGSTYSLVMNFTAYAYDNQESNFWGTARLEYLEVPENGSLDLDCGAGVACGFDVRQAPNGGGGTAVPEPASAALVAAGLTGMLAANRRRRNRRPPVASR